jgi:AcrR family transcriptional regulator
VPREDAPRQLTDQGRERRRQIVDAAVALFTARGYAATRVADICDAAGIAKGLFYWYFPTKQALFEDLVRTMRQRLRVAQGDAMDPSADPLTRLRQGTEASVRFIAEHSSYFALVEVERADPRLAGEVRDAFAEASDIYLRDVLALVKAAQGEGRVPDLDPALLSLGVMGAVSSFTHAWRNGRIDLDADELAGFVGDWVLRALGAASDAR